MTTIFASLRLRPTRIGFLVPPTDITQLRRIMQVCSCLWGGVYNPIIPVCDELPPQWKDPRWHNPTGLEVAKGYLEFFEPDVFVESERGLAARLGVQDSVLAYGQPRVLSLNSFFESERDDQANVPLGLSVLDLYQDLYDRQFQFVRRGERRVTCFEPGSSHDAFIEAAFGAFPADGFLSPLARAYQEVFDPLALPSNTESWVKVIREGCPTPLRFTAHDLKRDHGDIGHPTLFVVDPSSSLDLLDLWNLRQFAANVLPVNALWASEARDWIRELIISNHRPLPGNPHGVMIDTTVHFARSFSEDSAKQMVTELLEALPNGSWSYKTWYDRIWFVDRTEDRVVRPRRVRVTAASANLELPVTDHQKDKSIRFASLAPDFANPYSGDKARWANVLRLHTYETDESIAMVIPPDIDIETQVRIRLGFDGALPSREGLVLPQHFKDHGEYLHLFSGDRILIETLKQKGISAKPSGSSRIAHQILKSIGGFARAHLLADRETLKTLDEMAKSARHYRDGKTEEYPDRAKPVSTLQSLVEKRNNQKRRFSSLTLDDFVKAGVLRLGLAVQCPNCLNQNWCGLAEINEQITCERCLKPFDFPQGSLNFRRTPWQYRVVGPFSVPDFAGGSYATILALRVFSENLGDDAQLSYSTGLEIGVEEDKNEVDFAFWYQRRVRFFDHDEEPVLVFGESKSFAEDSFKEKDIERLERLATAFPGASLVFATMKDTLSSDEQAAIGKLARWGRERLTNGRPRSPVIALTGTELFSDWHIKHTWENIGGRHRDFASPAYVWLDNLWNFADLTQQLYLNLPDKWTENRASLTERAARSAGR